MDNTNDFINNASLDVRCRICWQQDGKILSPCKCSGSGKYIHQKCLKEWFERGVQQNMLKIKTLDNGLSSIPCQICKQQIIFKGNKKTGCLPSREIRHRICSQTPHFICKIITNLVYLAILAILILRLVESIKYSQQMIASHIILSVLILVATICYIKLLIPMMAEYFWGEGLLQIEFLPHNPTIISENKTKTISMQQLKYQSTYN